jgi:hypothetical protein
MEDDDSGMLIDTKHAACTAKAGPHYLMISLHAGLKKSQEIRKNKERQRQINRQINHINQMA